MLRRLRNTGALSHLGLDIEPLRGHQPAQAQPLALGGGPGGALQSDREMTRWSAVGSVSHLVQQWVVKNIQAHPDTSFFQTQARRLSGSYRVVMVGRTLFLRRRRVRACSAVTDSAGAVPSLRSLKPRTRRRLGFARRATRSIECVW